MWRGAADGIVLFALLAGAANARPAGDEASRAARAASLRASEAAATEQRIDAEVARATARLREAEAAAGAAADRLDGLSRARRRADETLAAHAAALLPLLPVMERMSMFPAETLVTAPTSPDRSLQALLVLRGMAARLETEAAALAVERARVERLVQAAEAEAPRLAEAQTEQARRARALDAQLAAAHAARIEADAGSTAVAARAAAAAAAAASAPSLPAVVATVARSQTRLEAANRPDVDAPASAAPGWTGGLTAPVAGRVVRGWGAPTPAGPARGLSYQAAPSARVVAPCGGTVAFAAPFRSYGQLIILACGGGWHAVLAGLARPDVQPGLRVRSGEPVGAMASWDPTSTAERPLLYLELRHGAEPVDPSPLLRGRG